MRSNESNASSAPSPKKGWLLPSLIQLDQRFSQRWDYWLRTLLAGHVLPEPIPQIKWLWTPHETPTRHLTDCLKQCHHHTAFESFRLWVDWLLYGFADSCINEFPTGVDPWLHARWHQMFQLESYLKYPYDYFGQYAAELYSTGRRNPTAYFPTPLHLSCFMAEMVMTQGDKTASVCDPCVGSGRLLMAASNYSLNLYGMDINPLIYKVCRVNMWCYVPWVVCRPRTLTGMTWVKTPLELGDSLIRQPVSKMTPHAQQQGETAVQLSLFDETPTEKGRGFTFPNRIH